MLFNQKVILIEVTFIKKHQNIRFIFAFFEERALRRQSGDVERARTFLGCGIWLEAAPSLQRTGSQLQEHHGQSSAMISTKL